MLTRLQENSVTWQRESVSKKVVEVHETVLWTLGAKRIPGIADLFLSQLDYRCFVWYNNNSVTGIIACFVDDMLWGGNSKCGSVINHIRQIFPISSNQVQSSTLQVVIRESQGGFGFPWLNYLLLWTFSLQCKNQRKYQSIFISLTFKSFWSLSHLNTLMFIIHEYFQHSILLISFLYLLLVLSLFEIALWVILKIFFSNCKKCKHIFHFTD